MAHRPPRLNKDIPDDVSSPVPALPERPGSWFITAFGSLSNADYRRLILVSLGTQTGFYIVMTAQGIAAYELTGNSGAVGLVSFGTGISALILTPLGGAVADRVPKKLIFVTSCFLMFTSIAIVASLTLAGHLTILALASNAIIVGSCSAFFVPARTAYIGDLVEPVQHGNAVAVNQIMMNTARIIGPLSAAALLAWKWLGYGGVFLVVAVFYGGILILSFMLPRTAQRPGRSSIVADVILGFRHVRKNPRLVALLTCFTVIVSFAQPYLVVLPALTKDVVGVGNSGFGILMGMAALGGLIASLSVASFVDSRKVEQLLYLATFGFGGSLCLMALSPTFVVLLPVMVLVGGFSSGFQVLCSAVALRESTPDYYGRLQSLMMIGFSLVGTVSLPIGLLADWIGERDMLLMMGIWPWLIGAIMIVWLRYAQAPGLESDALLAD